MRILILYGSQTGTAQDVAEYIWRESKKWHFHGPVLPMDDFPMKQLVKEKIVVFVVATTGDGTEPYNMRNSWKFLLRSKLPKNFLKDIKYACLGLGDSSYAKFNYAAKKLNKRLGQLGASPVIYLGLCDDQHEYGYYSEMFNWCNKLWEILKNSYNLPGKLEINEFDTFKWRCEVVNSDTHSDCTYNNDHILWPYKTKELCRKFQLLENTRLTASSHFQDVRLLRFAVPKNITWLPGATLEIHPHNSLHCVEQFFSLMDEHKLNINSHTVVKITSRFTDMPVPICYSKVLTVRQMVQCIWDLNIKPRQRVFQLLAMNCLDKLEKDRLIEFSTQEGLNDFINYIHRPRRTLLEVLQEFPQACSQLTLSILIEMFSLIQSRRYSIASCAKAETLDLLVAVVEYKTLMAVPRVGLCSNWLKGLKKCDEIWGLLNPGTLILPLHRPHPPLIMIGPGTGIAPFRSIIQNEIFEITKSETFKSQDYSTQHLIVYFGCRYRSKDFYFRNDFERWSQNGFINLYIAFSRDQEQKIYVQHLIKEHANHLKSLITQSNAHIFVAGSSKDMPKAVKHAFLQILENDENYLEKLIKTKRYQEETW